MNLVVVYVVVTAVVCYAPKPCHCQDPTGKLGLKICCFSPIGGTHAVQLKWDLFHLCMAHTIQSCVMVGLPFFRVCFVCFFVAFARRIFSMGSNCHKHIELYHN